MATITTRDIIQELIDGDGTTHGDPQCLSIWEYRQVPTRKIVWCVVYVKEDLKALVDSHHEIIKCLWNKREGKLGDAHENNDRS